VTVEKDPRVQPLAIELCRRDGKDPFAPTWMLYDENARATLAAQDAARTKPD